jgi:hypothetical protein
MGAIAVGRPGKKKPQRSKHAVFAPLEQGYRTGRADRWPNFYLEEQTNQYAFRSARRLKAYAFRVGKSEQSLDWYGLVIHLAHAARTSRARFLFLRQLCHQCFCAEHETGDRGGVL